MEVKKCVGGEIITLFSHEKKLWLFAKLMKIRFDWERPLKILTTDMKKETKKE